MHGVEGAVDGPVDLGLGGFEGELNFVVRCGSGWWSGRKGLLRPQGWGGAEGQRQREEGYGRCAERCRSGNPARGFFGRRHVARRRQPSRAVVVRSWAGVAWPAWVARRRAKS